MVVVFPGQRLAGLEILQGGVHREGLAEGCAEAKARVTPGAGALRRAAPLFESRDARGLGRLGEVLRHDADARGSRGRGRRP